MSLKVIENVIQISDSLDLDASCLYNYGNLVEIGRLRVKHFSACNEYEKKNELLARSLLPFDQVQTHGVKSL